MKHDGALMRSCLFRVSQFTFDLLNECMEWSASTCLCLLRDPRDQSLVRNLQTEGRLRMEKLIFLHICNLFMYF